MPNKKRPRGLTVAIGGAVLAMAAGTAAISIASAQAAAPGEVQPTEGMEGGPSKVAIGVGIDLPAARNQAAQEARKQCKDAGYLSFSQTRESSSGDDGSITVTSYVTCTAKS